MNKLKKIAAALILAATVTTSTSTLDAGCGPCNSGCAYDDCCQAPCISPSVALGTVALVAVVAVIVHNKKHHHGHSHSHS